MSEITALKVQGRRMLMGVSYYRLSKALGYSHVHVMEVLKGRRAGRPLLERVSNYLDNLEADEAEDHPTQSTTKSQK